MGIKKPTPQIFNTTLLKLGVENNEAVFVDDGKKNIEKAKELGMNGIVFESMVQLKSELEKFGVKSI